MKVPNQTLIEDLISRTKDNLARAETYRQLSVEELNRKPAPEKWSVLECLEHLNRYGDFYLPEIEKRIKNAKNSAPDALFRSGWLGNYFAKSMLPKEKLNKMKTLASMDPAGSRLDKSVLTKFIAHQQKMLDLLKAARTVDLTKTKTSISLTNWIKLRLGDTLRVVVYHNQRHIVQADKVIEQTVGVVEEK